MLITTNRFIFIILTSILFLQNGFSQSFIGKVIDDQNQPIENVTIYNKSNGKHTHSSTDGTFVLNKASINDTIQFSIIGYKDVALELDQSILNKEQQITLQISNISLEQIIITSELNVLSKIADVNVKNNPVISSQEILQKVPGLFIGQHAGGGKAEQIFLRGFDVDHGTDIAISVDGLPVNMVSHAHGQGYADLHFVIPETIESINFGKGPFYAEKGNFNTAGFVDLKLKESIDSSNLSLEIGQFETLRFVGLLNLAKTDDTNAYMASEVYFTDGPFESPQNFNRLNLMAQASHSFNERNRLKFNVSHFQSRWDASGQIPQRAVDQGIISRYGAIDDTEGGQTDRSNLLISSYNRLDTNKKISSKAFLSSYNFELYSNFTFFLNDSINGDQIRQKESRVLAGAETIFEHSNQSLFDEFDLDYSFGLGFRFDNNDDVELSRSLNRKTTLSTLSFGDVTELNSYGFFNAELALGLWKLVPGIRIDHFRFSYNDKLSEEYNNQSISKTIMSPKLNVILNAAENWQMFLKTGVGFHSNDGRVVIANQGTDILPKAYGVDLGTVIKPTDNLVVNATLWSLFLDQEFVYVGDEGIVEPSGKSKRLGLELGIRYQATDRLYFYSDLNYSHARYTQSPQDQNFIPLAPDLTSVGGLTFNFLKNFSGTLSYRYIDNRPANEDNSIVANGYFVSDATINYNYKNWQLSLIAENILDTDWEETQFATESRLFNETRPTEEIHFTPGKPFFIRGRLTLSF